MTSLRRVEALFLRGADEDRLVRVDVVLAQLRVDGLLVVGLDEVGLVHGDDGREVDAVVHHAVDEAVDVDLLTADGDVGVDVPVFAQDALDGALVQVQVGAGIDRQAVLIFRRMETRGGFRSTRTLFCRVLRAGARTA